MLDFAFWSSIELKVTFFSPPTETKASPQFYLRDRQTNVLSNIVPWRRRPLGHVGPKREMWWMGRWESVEEERRTPRLKSISNRYTRCSRRSHSHKVTRAFNWWKCPPCWTFGISLNVPLKSYSVFCSLGQIKFQSCSQWLVWLRIPWRPHLWSGCLSLFLNFFMIIFINQNPQRLLF